MIRWLGISARGFCMGIADVIPGVSGGTLALILGIYERFIAAVSAIGPSMLTTALSRDFWGGLGGRITTGDPFEDDESVGGHIVFLAFLGGGIVVAFLLGARFIPTLLDRHPAPMKGFFLGLVLASVVIPFRQMKRRRPVHFVACLVAAAATAVFVALPLDQSKSASGRVTVTLAEPTDQPTLLTPEGVFFLTATHGGEEKREVTFAPRATVEIPSGSREIEVEVVARLAGRVGNLPAGSIQSIHGGPPGATVTQIAATSGGVDPSLALVFVAGMLAISAMVLPGISGSFILLMLGLYHFITWNIRTFVYERDPSVLPLLAVFGVALVVGIAGFSRILNWLLHRAHDVTMAALVGLMLGSTRKIWPFTATDLDGRSMNVLPSGIGPVVLLTAGTFVVGLVTVIVLEQLGRRREPAAG